MIDITETNILPIGHFGPDRQPIFSVNPGVASEDALTQLSHLLRCAHASAPKCAMSER